MSANDVDPLMQGLDEELAGWGEPASRLREALAKDELALYCQPVAALSGPMRFPMAEVLIRLHEEEKAMLPPGEFLPAFEHYGMMPDLDRWVLRKVLEHIARGSRIERFAINVSTQTLKDTDFAKSAAVELVSAGVPGTSVLFEINEPTPWRGSTIASVRDRRARGGLRRDRVRLRPPLGKLQCAAHVAPRFREGGRRDRAQAARRARGGSQAQGSAARRRSDGLQGDRRNGGRAGRSSRA